MIQRGKQQKQSETLNSFQIYKQFLKTIQVTFQLCCQCCAENRSFFRFGKFSSMFRMTCTHLMGCSEWQQIMENPWSRYSEPKAAQAGLATWHLSVTVSLLGLEAQGPRFRAQSCPCHMGILDKPQLSYLFICKKKYFISISVFKLLAMTH